ncbi:39S ribosomal protein L38 mitochondrial [Biomphalaria pfeifferi]|uniref:Large ribosomal subunit protein mL38 n=1 Tax=Biomphalaria pfeifferi TaxID=112525 RepID=A0AAD8BBP3_BIOPF|nr:39S ribosomal protein L38 mitochondrial [Biomphalaria pfeifferi]
MATCMTLNSRLCVQTILKTKNNTLLPVRYRWKPPDPDIQILPPFSKRLADWKSRYQLPASHGINIGLRYDNTQKSSTDRTMVKKWIEKRQLLEAAARHGELHVDLDQVRDEWHRERMPEHVKTISEHHGIFRDLFDGAHFLPVIPLHISYDFNEEYVTPVRFGNIIPSCDASSKPVVNFESSDDSLWSLIMTSPDGNLEDSSKEILHWFIGNIPGSLVDKGETVCNYLQPFPPNGVGFLRYVFILFKQKKKIDFKDVQRPENCLSLKARSFSTLEFYRSHQEDMTPASLLFFQSEWDKSITSVFHHLLDMKEPRFEFLHPPEYYPLQEDYPHRRPFNVYLDNYRHIKDIQEEVLKVKLKDVDPLKPPAPGPKYPNTVVLPPSVPTWLKCKIQEMKLGKKHWAKLTDNKD